MPVNKFPIIDLHEDLLCHLTRRDFFPPGQSHQTSFEMIQINNFKLVVSTAFPVPPNENYFDPISVDMIEQEFLAYQKKTEDDPSWTLVKTADDVDRVLSSEGLHGLLLHIEGLNVFPTDGFSTLNRWYDIGLRSMGIVWNLTNELGGGTKDPSQGLTSLGVEVIEWCKQKNIVVDFAHMNEPTFWDVAKRVEKPIYISHGNCRSLCESPRNYTDAQLRAVRDSNGVIGIMFAKTYVTGRELPGSIADVIRHIDHLIETVGEDHIALGTDLGGIITGFVTGLESIDKLSDFLDALRAHGYSESVIEKICFRNAARVLKEHLSL